MNVINKKWGKEEIIVNKDYCGKRMNLHSGSRCSMHFHMEKHETFFVEQGAMLLETVSPEGIHNMEILKTGSSVEISPGTPHSFYGMKDTVFFEFSTRDEPEDSYRLDQSGRDPTEYMDKWLGQREKEE